MKTHYRLSRADEETVLSAVYGQDFNVEVNARLEVQVRPPYVDVPSISATTIVRDRRRDRWKWGSIRFAIANSSALCSRLGLFVFVSLFCLVSDSSASGQAVSVRTSFQKIEMKRYQGLSKEQ
jgi:hypothetical protein